MLKAMELIAPYVWNKDIVMMMAVEGEVVMENVEMVKFQIVMEPVFRHPGLEILLREEMMLWPSSSYLRESLSWA